jgi:hypothetical protein
MMYVPGCIDFKDINKQNIQLFSLVHTLGWFARSKAALAAARLASRRRFFSA